MKTLLPHKKMFFLLLGLVVCSLQSISVKAQTLDFRFRSPVAYDRAEVNTMLEQADKKIVVAGDIYYVGTRRVNGIVRLTAGGALDRTFNTDFDGWAEDIQSFKDGGYLVDDDGNLAYLDKTGKVVEYPEISVESMLVLPDNSFLVYDGGWIGKYTSNFWIDESFGDGGWVYVNGEVEDMELQGDKIIVAGDFSYMEDFYGGYDVNDLARLNMDGSVDTSFDAGYGTDDQFESITVQSDGKILLGNSYISWFDDYYFGGRIVRLNSDGSVDQNFYTDWFGWVGELGYSNGKILVPSESNETIYRLNEDGSRDNDFNEIYFDELSDDLVTLQLRNGEFLAANAPTDEGMFGLHRFKTSGARYTSFKPAIATDGWIYSIVKSGSRIYVAGYFFKLNNVLTNNIGRLQSNGSPDQAFRFTDDVGGAWDLDAFSDGSVLVNTDWYSLIKLRTDGTWDEEFNLDNAWPLYYNPAKVYVQPDDKFVVMSDYGITRRNSDGSVDGSFTSQENNWSSSYWADFDLQSDGKIIYGSAFSQLNGVSVDKIVRLNTDGTLDNTFDVGSGPQYYTKQIIVLDNDEIVVKGYFGYFNGTYVTPYWDSGIVKLDADGALDATFKDNRLGDLIYSPYYYLASGFRNGVIFIGYDYGQNQWESNFVTADGTQSEIFPSTVAVDWAEFYSPDNRSLYIVGETYVRNADNSTPIVRITYPAMRTNVLAAGRQDVNGRTMRVFPNPSTDFISFDVDSPVRVNILSMDGAIKVDKQIGSVDDLIDVSHLKPGRYVVKVNSNGKIRTEHLIKN